MADRELLDARFAAIDAQITANDRLYAERSDLLQRLYQKQHDDNVQMRMQQFDAAQQAIQKSEDAVRYQLIKIEELNETNNRALSERISAEKDRITGIESRFKGAGQLWAIFIGATGLLFVLLGFIYSMQ